jgi:hypothetical protein
LTVKGVEAPDDRQEDLLANFLDVLVCEFRAQLEDKSRRGRVVLIKERVPSLGIAPTAAGQQFGLVLHLVGDFSRRAPAGQVARRPICASSLPPQDA